MNNVGSDDTSDARSCLTDSETVSQRESISEDSTSSSESCDEDRSAFSAKQFMIVPLAILLFIIVAFVVVEVLRRFRNSGSNDYHSILVNTTRLHQVEIDRVSKKLEPVPQTPIKGNGTVENMAELKSTKKLSLNNLTVTVDTWNVGGVKFWNSRTCTKLTEGVDSDLYILGVQELKSQGYFGEVNHDGLSRLANELQKFLKEYELLFSYIPRRNGSEVGTMIFLKLGSGLTANDFNIKEDFITFGETFCGPGMITFCSLNCLRKGKQRFGNKQSAMVFLQHLPSKQILTIVNTHLPAHAGKKYHKRRIECFKQTVKQCHEFCSYNFDVESNSESDCCGVKKNIHFENMNIVFLGDLNFRLKGVRRESGCCSDKDVIRKGVTIPAWKEGQDNSELIAMDELVTFVRKDPRKKHILSRFRNTDPPDCDCTYKIDRYGNHDDRRVKAWCDRILWQMAQFSVELHSYTDVKDLNASDHKAVRATMTLREISKTKDGASISGERRRLADSTRKRQFEGLRNEDF